MQRFFNLLVRTLVYWYQVYYVSALKLLLLGINTDLSGTNNNIVQRVSLLHHIHDGPRLLLIILHGSLEHGHVLIRIERVTHIRLKQYQLVTTKRVLHFIPCHL